MPAIEMSAEEIRDLKQLVDLAIPEDVGGGDITTRAVVPKEAQATGRLVARSPGILAGIEAARLVFEKVDPSLVFEALLSDGTSLVPGTEIARVAGSARSILTGERTALNFLQRLSGVASNTRKFVDAAAGKVDIFDTRKTMPCFRRMDKYAVRAGGGKNHRLGLYDQVLIKENHLSSAGGIKPCEAVLRAREAAPEGTLIEVEVENLAEFRDALTAAPDVIMLDDMSVKEMAAAVQERGASGRPLLEVSGGVGLDKVKTLAGLGVDRLSVGALTHSAPALDLAMDFRVA